MRILIADQNAVLLAAIAATFGRHCEIVTATCRDACMELVEQGQFDVVVACEKLADYTGLELLSEIEALCPATIQIFAARPESLKRLGKRLDLFGLLGTLSYPIEARKLVVALKVARSKLPARPKPLEEAPPPPPEIPVGQNPPYCGDLAANDEACVGEPGPARTQARTRQSTTKALVQPEAPCANSTGPQPGASRAAAIAKLAGAAATPTAAAKKQTVAKGPRPRKPTTPTAAQREAFQRALARRNAARAGGVDAETQRSMGPAGLPGSRGSGKVTGPSNGRAESPPIDFSNVRVPNTWVASGFGAPPLPSQSLKDLARMATTKRPLPGAPRTRPKVQPKRGVFFVGSGIAVVSLVGVLCFDLLRLTPPVEHGRHAHAGVGGTQLFSPNSTLVADSSAGSPQVFSAPPRQPDQAPSLAATPGMAQPQTFDPDSAPPDPPPPALEHAGPMEPPSMAHIGPPVSMQPGSDSQNGWNE